LAEVVLRLKQQVFMKKEFVFRHGDFGDSMFFINTGTVLIYLDMPDRPDGGSTPLKPLVTLEVGKAFGELAIFFRQPRAAGAVASTVVTAMSLD
jgi:CRP-like cAMP-binding protein